MQVRITLDNGIQETRDLGGVQFAEFCQEIMRNGYYANANHSLWYPSSRIEEIEIIGETND